MHRECLCKCVSGTVNLKNSIDIAIWLLCACLLPACTEKPEKEIWLEKGIYIHTSADGSIEMISDGNPPASETIEFPKKIDHPISVSLGENASRKWTDEQFVTFTIQLPEELKYLFLHVDFPKKRVKMLQRNLRQIDNLRVRDPDDYELLKSLLRTPHSEIQMKDAITGRSN